MKVAGVELAGVGASTPVNKRDAELSAEALTHVSTLLLICGHGVDCCQILAEDRVLVGEAGVEVKVIEDVMIGVQQGEHQRVAAHQITR